MLTTIQFFSTKKKWRKRSLCSVTGGYLVESSWLSFSSSARLSVDCGGSKKSENKSWRRSYENFWPWRADSSSATRRIELCNFTAAYEIYLVWHGDDGELHWWVACCDWTRKVVMAPAKTNRLQVSLHSHLDWISKLQMAISPLCFKAFWYFGTQQQGIFKPAVSQAAVLGNLITKHWFRLGVQLTPCQPNCNCSNQRSIDLNSHPWPSHWSIENLHLGGMHAKISFINGHEVLGSNCLLEIGYDEKVSLNVSFPIITSPKIPCLLNCQ